jgi:hypothetical protein
MSKIIDLLYNGKSSLENKTQRPGLLAGGDFRQPSRIYGEMSCDLGSTGVTLLSIFNAPVSGATITVYDNEGVSGSYILNSLYLASQSIGLCSCTGTLSTPMTLSSVYSNLIYTVGVESSRPLGASIGGPVYGYGNLRSSTRNSTISLFMTAGFSTGDKIRYTRVSTGQTGTTTVSSIMGNGTFDGIIGPTFFQRFKADTPFTGSTCVMSLDAVDSSTAVQNLRYIASRSRNF